MARSIKIDNTYGHYTGAPTKELVMSTLGNLSTIMLEEDAIAPCMSNPFSHVDKPPKLKE